MMNEATFTRLQNELNDLFGRTTHRGMFGALVERVGRVFAGRQSP